MAIELELTEEQFVTKVIESLSPYFNIQREIWSKSGKSRIDLVIEDKKQKDVYFGIEAKRMDKRRGEMIGSHIEQCVRYSKEYFEVKPKVFVKIPIVICPPLSFYYLCLNEQEVEIDGKTYILDRHDKYFEHHTVNGILGVFNIGELKTIDKKTRTFCILFSNKIIWSNKKFYDSHERRWTNDYRGIHPKFYPLLIEKINVQ